MSRIFGFDENGITHVNGQAAAKEGTDVAVIDGNSIAMMQGPAAEACLLYTSPSPRDQRGSRMPSSA